MPRVDRPKTIGELRESGYQASSVKEEMRRNLIGKIERGEELFPGIIGFEESVVPQIENAILAGQDIIFLARGGQAKSRLIRHLVSLLDEEVPVIAGCELNDSPYAPICRRCRDQAPTPATKWRSRGCHAINGTPRSWRLRTSRWPT